MWWMKGWWNTWVIIKAVNWIWEERVREYSELKFEFPSPCSLDEAGYVKRVEKGDICENVLSGIPGLWWLILVSDCIFWFLVDYWGPRSVVSGLSHGRPERHHGCRERTSLGFSLHLDGANSVPPSSYFVSSPHIYELPVPLFTIIDELPATLFKIIDVGTYMDG